jgi:hypothetical protein
MTMLRSARCLVVVTLIAPLLGTAGCRSKTKPQQVVARVGNQTVTLDQVDKNLAQDLFEMRHGVLQKLIADTLLSEEARKRGVSLEELWRAEVDGKVPVPDAETIQKTVDSWIAEGRVTPEEASRMSPETAGARVRRFRVQMREQAYFDSLFDRSAVQIDFGTLGRPSLKIANDGPSLGAKDARITIVEFADLTQPFTALWQPTLERLLEKHGQKVRFLFKQKPAAADSPGAGVAEASLCANDQDRYWEFRKALFQQKRVSAETATAAAASAKLDMSRFNECLSSGRNKQNVSKNLQEALANNLEGEPVLFVNGIRLSGAQPFTAVDRLLRNEMTRL